MHVACIAGARPNFVKIKPLVDALERAGAVVTLIHTGQHYDDPLSAVMIRDLRLRRPDHHLHVGSGPRAVQIAETVRRLHPVITDLSPDVVVIVGDVNATLAGALVGSDAALTLAHVEAGLRSGDRTMPEELNRLVTDHLSDLLFAPSADAVDNLLAEGVSPESVHMVGNVVIDSLLANLDRARQRPILADLGLTAGEYGLVTLHRPENVDAQDRFDGLLDALERVSRRLRLVYPAHPRALRALERSSPHGLEVLQPLGYLDFIALQASAALVMTDSGGVQEETTVLGVPCLTLRRSTERPATVTCGTNVVVGTNADDIATAADRALRQTSRHRVPEGWDGRAAERVAEILLRHVRRKQ